MFKWPNQSDHSKYNRESYVRYSMKCNGSIWPARPLNIACNGNSITWNNVNTIKFYETTHNCIDTNAISMGIDASPMWW